MVLWLRQHYGVWSKGMFAAGAMVLGVVLPCGAPQGVLRGLAM